MKIAGWVYGIILVSAVAVGTSLLLSDRTSNAPNRVLNEVTFDPPADQLVAGTFFKVRVHTTIVRPCPFQIRWSLVDDLTDEQVYRSVEPLRVRAKANGPVDEEHSHFIAAHVKPGNYRYETQIFDLCPGTRASVTIPAAVPVVIH